MGAVVERASFNAWGERRLSNWTGSSGGILSLSTRGFTGHEMDDNVGLINMNARMYDAKLGRFLQPDTYVQFPESTQGFNRYTYVENNPLSYTDPTGNFNEGRESDNTVISREREDNRVGGEPRNSRNNDSSRNDSGSSSREIPVRDSKSVAANIGREGTKYTNKDQQRDPDSGNLTDDVYVRNGITTLVIRGGYNDQPIRDSGFGGRPERSKSTFDTSFRFILDVVGVTSVYNVLTLNFTYKDVLQIGVTALGGALVYKFYKVYKGRSVAQKALDISVTEIRNLSKTQQRKVATVVGAYNKKTGVSGVGVGVKRTGCDRGKCAEDLALEAVRGKPEDVLLTPAVRPRLRAPGDRINVCMRCQGTFGRNQFPRGTKFD